MILMTGAGPKAKQKAPPAEPGSEVPADLNRASLRMDAVDMLYELDLPAEQLKVCALPPQYFAARFGMVTDRFGVAPMVVAH